MATRIEWSKLGLKLVCETSRRPVPKTEQAFPIPDFGLNGSPLISAVLETVAASGRTGIRVATLAAGLPGSATNGTFWTLIHSAAIGAGLPSLVAYDVEPPTINLLFEAPLGGATHKFHLICSSEGRNTVYPEVSVNTPADEIVSSLGGITDPDTLVPSEKVQIVQDYNVLTGENADLISKAASAGVSSSAYSTAYTALATTYLPTLTSPVLWSSLTGNTALGTGNRVALWNPKWLALRSAAADLKAAIALAAVNTANTASGAASTANSNATTALNNAPANVNGLPALPNATYPSGKLVYDTVTKRLYRSTGSAWESTTTAAADVIGTLIAGQVPNLSALNGTALAGQIPVLDFSTKIGGATKPADNATVGAPSGTPVGSTTADLAAKSTSNYLGQTLSITLGGSQTSFYPVLVAANTVMTGNVSGAMTYELTVFRPDVHENSSFLGSYAADCTVRAYAYGHAPGRVKRVDQSIGGGTYNWGLADVYPNTANQAIVLMLRGGMTHYVAMRAPQGSFTLTAYMSGYSDATGANFPVQSTGTLGNYLDMSYRPDSRLHGNASIVARTITADRIKANEITANEIAANTITANLMAANSVLSKNILVTNFDNLIPNPNSEQPAPAGGWPAGAYEAIGLTNVGGTSGAWQRFVSAGWYQIAPLVPCAPGDQFYFEAQTLSDNVASNARIVVDFLDSAGAYLFGFYAYNNTTGWVKKSVTGTAPANAVFARFMIGGETATSHYDEMYARKMLDGNLVVDGTLSASKIVADSITSGQISAGAIGTPELAAGSVTAAKMVVQAASLISDPCFESGPAGWAGHTGLTLPGSGSGGCPGRYYSQFNARDCVSNTGFDVYPGEKFYCQISCHAYGGSGAGGFGMVALGEDRSGTVIYANIVATTTYYADWATISGTLTVPANVVKMRLGPWMDLPYTWVSANGGPLFTNFIVRKMNNAELIVDGAITANKLEADLAMVNTIRSTNYNGNASTQSTVGFKIQGTAFNAKDAYGATQSVQADFAANMLIGGYRAAVITNRVIGNSQVWNTAQTTTWVCPEGITNVELLIVAAGGGGQGSATNNYGGDGGSGGQGIKRRIAVVPGTTYTLVIGTGGAGGTAGGGNGGNGENSSMSGSGFSTITMTGGVGSASSGSGANGGYWNTFDNGSVANGGIGGSGGNIGLGQPPALVGGACWDFGGGDNGNTANSSGPGGGGGASCLAAGGAGETGAVAGVAGTLGSGGGGGGCSTTAQTAGGRGGDGYIRISW